MMFPQYSPVFEHFPRFLSLFYLFADCFILFSNVGFGWMGSWDIKQMFYVTGGSFFPRSCIGKNWMIWMFFFLHPWGFKCYVFDKFHSLLNPDWLVKFRHKIILLASDHFFRSRSCSGCQPMEASTSSANILTSSQFFGHIMGLGLQYQSHDLLFPGDHWAKYHYILGGDQPHHWTRFILMVATLLDDDSSYMFLLGHLEIFFPRLLLLRKTQIKRSTMVKSMIRKPASYNLRTLEKKNQNVSQYCRPVGHPLPMRTRSSKLTRDSKRQAAEAWRKQVTRNGLRLFI